MIWLFNVNVLIAIADPEHVFHHAIHRWLTETPDKTWASCSITENGMVRVLTQAAYRSGARSATEAVATLRQMKEATPWRHVFWAEELSMTDSQAIYAERIAGAKQVTDVYLAALALRNAGRLVTFDSRVPWQAVASGTARLIEIPVR